MNFHSPTNSYADDRYSLILQVEEGGNPHLTPYNDGKGWVTIGVDFNLADDAVRTLVLGKMGITNPLLINDLTNYLKDNKLTTSYSVIQSVLNSFMTQYTPGSTFQFANETQVKELFNGIDGNNGLVQTYENRVDKWASDKGLAVIPESKERLVLVSFSYNGVLGPSLAAAIKTDNRAEAWYEIRYGSNGDKLNGIAKRRYYESEVFGLTANSDSVSDAEAQNILQMYTRHRADILNYEATYSAQIDAANNDYHLSGTSLVESLDQMLDAARNYIISAEVTARGITHIIDGDVLVGQNTDYINSRRTWHKNDSLIGTDKHDLILGGDGDDTLEGGKGNDILVGGIGLDRYIWNAGDGTDTIIDEDKQGLIIINNGSPQNLFAAGAFVETAPGSGVWTQTMADGSILTLTHHSPWRLVTADGSEIILGNDWQDGDFGIHLQNVIMLPGLTPAQEIPGDLAPKDFDAQQPGVQMQTDALGNIITDPNVAEPGRADTLYGSAGSDRIAGLLGTDILDGKEDSLGRRPRQSDGRNRQRPVARW